MRTIEQLAHNISCVSVSPALGSGCPLQGELFVLLSHSGGWKQLCQRDESVYMYRGSFPAAVCPRRFDRVLNELRAQQSLANITSTSTASLEENMQKTDVHLDLICFVAISRRLTKFEFAVDWFRSFAVDLLGLVVAINCSFAPILSVCPKNLRIREALWSKGLRKSSQMHWIRKFLGY